MAPLGGGGWWRRRPAVRNVTQSVLSSENTLHQHTSHLTPHSLQLKPHTSHIKL